MFEQFFVADQAAISDKLEKSQIALSPYGTLNYHLPGESKPWLRISSQALDLGDKPDDILAIATLLHQPFLNLLKRFPYTGSAGVVTKETLEIGGGLYDVALKRFVRFPFGEQDTTADEQFEVMHLLMADGYKCVTPLGVYQNRMLSMWETGDHPDSEDPQFKNFWQEIYFSVRGYQKLGLVRGDLRADSHGFNYFTMPTADASTPVRSRYKIMDPLVKPLIINSDY